MPHDSNGRIFTQNGQGIDVRGDVAYVLGRSTGDVGQLCGDVDANGNAMNSINAWSAHKPVEHNYPGLTTDQKFAELHYGLDAHARLGSLMQQDYSNFYWGYTKATTWFRVLDFNGYNHAATAPDLYTWAYPIYVNVAAENGRFRITFYSDASEIPILNESYQSTSQAGAPSAALSEWIVVLLIYISGESNAKLYNTEKTLGQFAASGLIDYHDAITTSMVGKTATLVPALVYPNNQMVAGINNFSGSFLNNYYFIPLSFTSSMESTKVVPIEWFEWLVGMSIGNDTMVKPHTGYNYYSFTSIGVIAQQNNIGSATGTFKLRFGIKRVVDGQTKVYYSITQYDNTITSTSSQAPYVWYFPTNTSGTITFNPAFREEGTSVPVTAQSGDTFFLEATLMRSTEELQQVTKNVGTQS